MRRAVVFAAALTLLGTRAQSARAAEDCPDGDWFCEPPPAAEAPASPTPPPGAEAPSQGQPPRSRRRPRPLEPPPPDALSFAPPPPPSEAESSMHFDYERGERRPPRRRGYREWGLNLHAVIGLMGNDAYMSPDADMNGLGAALRFRPLRWFALEGAGELIWGTDYNGFQRFERALLVNGLFFANPRSAVQLYGIAGVGLGAALLDSGTGSDGQPILRDEAYAYAGGQVGFGLEGRVTRHFALGADLIGFLRWRHDRHASDEPEFIDPVSGRTSNTSGGGLLRLGATFYW